MFDFCPAARMQVQIHVMILYFDVYRPLISHEASLNLLGQESFLGLSSLLTPSSWQFGQLAIGRSIRNCAYLSQE